MYKRRKKVPRRGPHSINLDIFVYSFDIYRFISIPFYEQIGFPAYFCFDFDEFWCSFGISDHGVYVRYPDEIVIHFFCLTDIILYVMYALL